jgi:hypothetical protein
LLSPHEIIATALHFFRASPENYFPDEIVKREFGPTYRALAPYERLNNADPHWGKSQNWQLAAAMDIDAIKKTDLGKFLESL